MTATGLLVEKIYLPKLIKERIEQFQHEQISGSLTIQFNRGVMVGQKMEVYEKMN